MHTIKIYSTPTCPYCHMAKEYLKEKKIEFTDYDVASDAVARDEMIKNTNQMGVPVIDIDGKDFIIGFDKQALDNILDIK